MLVMGRMRGPALRGHALAQRLQRFVGLRSQLRCPGKGGQRQLLALLRAESHLHGSRLHRIQKIKHVGRPAAGDRGNGVDQRFLDGPQVWPTARNVSAAAVLRRRHARSAARPVTPMPISAGVFGMARTMAP